MIILVHQHYVAHTGITAVRAIYLFSVCCFLKHRLFSEKKCTNRMGGRGGEGGGEKGMGTSHIKRPGVLVKPFRVKKSIVVPLRVFNL